MNYRDYLNQLRAPHPVYLFYGTEKFLINFLIEETKKKFVNPGFESMNYIYMDGQKVNFSDIENANETLPFMAEKKVVIVEDYSVLMKKSREDDEAEERMTEYIKNPNTSSILIFLLNTDKIDGRRKIFKALKKHAQVIELNKLTGNEPSGWIEKHLREKGKKISRSGVEKIIEYTGYFDNEGDTDLLSLKNEIKKLADYTGDRDTVTSEDIEAVITKSLQSSIFNLVDAIADKNLSKSVRNLENMLESGGVVPVILHMIARQFRMIYSVKLYINRGYTQGAVRDKMNIRYDFIMNKLVKQSRNFSVESLEKAIKDCADLDLEMKTGKIEERLGLEKLIIKIENYR